MFSQDPSVKRIFVVGNSHTGAMSRALDDVGQPERTDIRIANINKVWDRLNAPETPNLGALICALYRETMGRRGADLIVARLGGNEHSILGTLETARPFDFTLEGQPDLPNRERLTNGFVRAAMQSKVQGALRHLPHVARTLRRPALVVEVPPPIPDDRYVAEHLDKFFSRTGSPSQVAPALLRWKMWRLQCDVARQLACAAGAAYLPSPHTVIDADGYLARPYWGNDATHGNTAYGAVINEAIAAYAHAADDLVACHA